MPGGSYQYNLDEMCKSYIHADAEHPNVFDEVRPGSGNSKAIRIYKENAEDSRNKAK